LDITHICAQDLGRGANEDTTALSHPVRWTPSVQHMKGRPSTAVSHELRPGNPSFASIGLPTKALPRTAERQKRSILQGLGSPWDTVPANAQDATKQRGAETTERQASFSIKRDRKHNFGKDTRQNSDSDSQVHTQPTQGHNSDTTERQEQGRNKRLWANRRATSGSGHKDVTKPQHSTANAGRHSGYSNSSIHTLYTAEILQLANGCHKEEARTTTLCSGMARPAGDLNLRHKSH